MALTLKSGQTITDNYGNEYADAYLVIDQLNGNKGRKDTMLVVEIYKDQQARTDKKSPVSSESYTVTGEDFDTWFSCEAVQNDGDQYQRAYEYIKQLEENIGTENEPEMVLKYSKWEDLV